MTVLVTGAHSGLGKYLANRLSGQPFTRANDIEDIRDRRFQFIIHCAFNRCRDASMGGIAQVVNDNIILTQELLRLKCDVFIYVSSIDVYPRNGLSHNEDEVISPSDLVGLYSVTKHIAESLICNSGQRYIILRPGLLLGEYMRSNTISRIATEPNASLTLSADSTFYAVDYCEVALLIEALLSVGGQGTYNVVRGKPVSLGEVASFFGRCPSFGSHRYDSGKVTNAKAAALIPSLSEDSMSLIRKYFHRTK